MKSLNYKLGMDTNHNNKHRKDFWTRLSTAVQFTDNGLYGLMDTNGDVVLDANYVPILYMLIMAHAISLYIRTVAKKIV